MHDAVALNVVAVLLTGTAYHVMESAHGRKQQWQQVFLRPKKARLY